MEQKNVYTDGESWKTGSSSKQERMELYLEWILTAEDARTPSTKKEFAAMLGVTVQTLANYDNDPWFRKEISTRAKRYFKAQRLPEIIDSMFEIATDPSNRNAVSAARLLVDWSERVAEEAQVDLSARTLAELEEMMKNG